MSKWVVTAKSADFNKIGEYFGIDPVVARLLRNRDLVTLEEIESFLKGKEEDCHSPYLLPDMEKAVSIIVGAIEEKQSIRIVGDYDVDGVTSTFILLKGLKAMGADVDYAIPNRVLDGYGVNENLIEQANNDKRNIIITCDNGIAAFDAFERAGELGIKCIITDHHEVKFEDNGISKEYIYPKAEAIVNPKRHDSKYPFKGICGAMVAYKLICALGDKLDLDGNVKAELREMAGLGTVCDVMELRDENRIIVRLALKSMENSSNIGIRALRKVCEIDKKPISSYHMGFIMGPCINATGRLDDATLSLKLLLSENMEEAVATATKLKGLNDLRKDLTEQGLKQALAAIEENRLYENRVIVVYLPEVHESLAGIIAGRIREKYYRPAFVLTNGEEGIKGSGRSIEAYHMYEELLKVSEVLTRYGGHKMAAGVSLEKEKLSDFIEGLNNNCKLSKDELTEKTVIDVPMPLSYVNERIVNDLSILEPFGQGNQKPVFADKDLRLLSVKPIGKTGDMAKLAVTKNGSDRYELLLFRGFKEFEERLTENGVMDISGNSTDYSNIILDIIYYPGINGYNGRKSLQFIVQDFKIRHDK